MQHNVQLTVVFILCQVLLPTSTKDLECIPGFQQKVFHIEHSSAFTVGQPILNLVFDDCQENHKLNFEVSSPDFKVEPNGALVALRNLSDAERALVIRAQSAQAEDTAEVLIVGRKEKSGSLKERFKAEDGLGSVRQRRSIVAPQILIPENQRPPFPKLVGKVIDNDRPEGSKFRIFGKGVEQEPKGIFKIIEGTGELFVTQQLDREAIATYELQVEITDISGKTIEGPVPFDIVIIDQNDNRPIFREGPYIGHVMEGSPTGSTVMRVTAFDADDTSTDNAVLRYNILKQTPDKPSPNMFYIDPEKGDIVTVVSPAMLDRETMENPKYELILEAKDMAGHEVGLTGTTTATIVIDDKNDHAPEFTKKEFQATVKEGSTGVIVNLTVEDRDDPATAAWKAVYTIINGNPAQSFKIHTNAKNNEGMLSVVKPLDYEISAFHTLLIKVENEDLLVPDVLYDTSSTATVQITVLDVNEGPIFHPNPMVVTKLENIPIGSVVLTVNATDPDTLQHQTIRFSTDRDPADWLEINPTNGTIRTKGMLDRESPSVLNNVYTASFLAIDSGSPPATGTGTLQIILEDVNDNIPSLYPTVASVCEDAKDVKVVFGALDKDIHPKQEPFKFELSKQSGQDKVWKLTRINNTHSQIAVPPNLKKANYIIPISVTDPGTPPLTNNTELKIQVCSCTKYKVDCSGSPTFHTSTVLIFLWLFSLCCL
ncbi:cadherin-13 [Pantherophis guttatus]|uniref:Cadherin-13 n=1 Tax=Pantherophis guttatus TaxID=94885 RepID=A0A6P9CDP0_PANGU|nr:cadherin-13 [Pantherophis guttatus]